MSAPLEITERFLSDAGGWQALKEARGLWEAGKASDVTYEAPFLRGTVRDGVKEYRSGLRIVTRTNIENLCTCRISRERGMVCAHSLSVGLLYIKGPYQPAAASPSGWSAPAIQQAESTVADSAPPGRPEFLLEIEGSLNHLEAKLQARYSDRTIRAGDPAPGPIRYRDANGTWRTRNLDAENAALDRLRRAGFTQANPTTAFVLKGERQILNFLGSTYPALEREWSVRLGARFNNINDDIARVRPKLEIQSSGENWFEMSVSLATPEGQAFSSAEIQRLLQMGQNHVRMKNGVIALFDTQMLDELGTALADADPAQQRPGTYRIGKAHAGYIEGLLGDAITSTEPGWKKWTRQQLQPDAIAPVPLGDLENTLRPYQKHGVYWMHFLARNSFGGILADEMGLGKTLQALAFLAGLDKAGEETSLIVCPSSLVQNWAREAAKFTPQLKVIAIEGPNRQALFAKLPDADLAITSYPLLRRDAERYASLQFNTIILDEAQHIKNPETQNAQAATALRARHRFVLTGTPLENSVRDLWSIMQFVMPGYLGDRDDFKQRYELPITQEADSAPIKRRLARRVRPFLLRRLKSEVYKDLPEKLQQVVYADLTARQAEVYQGLLDQTRRTFADLASTKDQGKSRILMLTALLRLRQACCDLRLLDLPNIDPSEASAKMDLLDELLREAIDGGHRVLIFSQFVSMLRIQKEAFDAAGIPYCYLDGSTKNRMAEVDRFQTDPNIPVFLISLKAGGTGLNLTAADTVIHFDPWWNPAVEAQATDRAHRIGQEKTVTAYKLITRNTVEEKILKLQEKKRNLIEAIENEEPLLTSLTTEDLQSLIE
jgi:superfamily II DNA or RNA helicase